MALVDESFPSEENDEPHKNLDQCGIGEERSNEILLDSLNCLLTKLSSLISPQTSALTVTMSMLKREGDPRRAS